MISQGGLFTKASLGVDIEQWVRTYYAGEDRNPCLIKVRIPDVERRTCLKRLNEMNINHLSLFPDLYGASKFCNTKLEISNY